MPSTTASSIPLPLPIPTDSLSSSSSRSPTFITLVDPFPTSSATSSTSSTSSSSSSGHSNATIRPSRAVSNRTTSSMKRREGETSETRRTIEKALSSDEFIKRTRTTNYPSKSSSKPSPPRPSNRASKIPRRPHSTIAMKDSPAPSSPPSQIEVEPPRPSTSSKSASRPLLSVKTSLAALHQPSLLLLPPSPAQTPTCESQDISSITTTICKGGHEGGAGVIEMLESLRDTGSLARLSNQHDEEDAQERETRNSERYGTHRSTVSSPSNLLPNLDNPLLPRNLFDCTRTISLPELPPTNPIEEEEDETMTTGIRHLPSPPNSPPLRSRSTLDGSYYHDSSSRKDKSSKRVSRRSSSPRSNSKNDMKDNARSQLRTTKGSGGRRKVSWSTTTPLSTSPPQHPRSSSILAPYHHHSDPISPAPSHSSSSPPPPSSSSSSPLRTSPPLPQSILKPPRPRPLTATESIERWKKIEHWRLLGFERDPNGATTEEGEDNIGDEGPAREGTPQDDRDTERDNLVESSASTSPQHREMINENLNERTRPEVVSTTTVSRKRPALTTYTSFEHDYGLTAPLVRGEEGEERQAPPSNRSRSRSSLGSQLVEGDEREGGRGETGGKRDRKWWQLG